MSYTMEDAQLLAQIIGATHALPHALEELLEQRYESRAAVHRRLIEYGNALARSYPDRDEYARCFDVQLHGGDSVSTRAPAPAMA
jgi:hypothetical protein